MSLNQHLESAGLQPQRRFKRTAEDLTMETRQRVAPYEMVLRRLGFREGTQNDNLMRLGASNWLMDLDSNKYDASRMAVVFEKDGSVTIMAGDSASAGPSDYSWHYRNVTPARLSSHISSSLWAIERRQVAAMDATIARELAKIAGELMGVTRTAAVKDLAEIRELIPAMLEKRAERTKKQEEYLRETNRLYDEEMRDIEESSIELSASLRDAIVGYFNKNGMGVQRVEWRDGERGGKVYIGSGDGVKRRESAVWVGLSIGIGGPSNEAYFAIRNENYGGEDHKFILTDKGTVSNVVKTITQFDKRGYWDGDAGTEEEAFHKKRLPSKLEQSEEWD
jgi:hypothetical protein